MNLYSLVVTASLIICLPLAIYVLKQNVRSIRNLTFAWAALSVCVMQFGVLEALRSSNWVGALFWSRVSLVGICLALPSWTLFSIVFFREDYRVGLKRGRWLLFLICSAAIIFLVLAPSDLFIERVIESGHNRYTIYLGFFGYVFAICCLLVLVAVLFNFERTFRQTRGEHRDRIKPMFLGFVAASALYVYIGAEALLFHSIELNFFAIGSVGVAFSCALSAYSIVRYRLLDSRITIGRQVMYSSVTFLLAGLFLLLVGLLGRSLHRSPGWYSDLLVAIFSFWAIFLLFSLYTGERLKERIKTFVDRNFYRFVHDYREQWVEFGKRTTSIIGLDELVQVILKFVSEAVGVSEVSIFLFDRNSGRFSVAGPIGGCSLGASIEEDGQLAKFLHQIGGPVAKKTILRRVSSLSPEEKAMVEDVEIFAPLTASEDLIGILALGRKDLRREKFWGDDLTFIGTIADQASVAINNARLSEELASSRELGAFYGLSSFVVHDLRNSVSMLSMLLENADKNFDDTDFQKDALEGVAGVISRMKGLISKFSSVPEELELNPGPCDLNELVKNTASRIKTREEHTVKLNLEDIPVIEVDSGYIEKVLENLILNGIEALDGPGGVEVATFDNDKYVDIRVSDTGRGMSREYIQKKLFKPFQTTKRRGLGIGLYQVKTIIEAHRGKVRVESTPGGGSVFTVSLPKKFI